MTASVRSLAIAMLTAGALCHAAPAFAAEGAASPYLNGYRSFLTGIVPPHAGVYVRNDLVFYQGDVKAAVLAGRAQVGVRGTVMADFLAPTVVTDHKILGATYAYGFALTLVQQDVLVGLRTPNRVFVVDDGLFDAGDAIVSPLILGWHNGNFHTTLSLSAIVPIGRYHAGDLANTGRNFWTFLPQVGFTYFEPKSGWDASLAVSYVATSSNHATHYDTGDILHIEAALGKQVGPIKIGIAGYAQEQLTGDSGSGAALGSFKSRVYGIGPAVESTIKGVSVSLKWATEFDAKNALEGDSVMLTGGFKF